MPFLPRAARRDLRINPTLAWIQPPCQPGPDSRISNWRGAVSGCGNNRGRAQRYSILTFRPSTQPSSASPFKNNAIRASAGRPKWESRITLPPLVCNLADGRSHALDAGRVGDHAVLDRHVEIDVHEHTLAPHVTETSAMEDRSLPGRSDQLAHCNRGVDHAVGEAPFVIIPRHHPH